MAGKDGYPAKGLVTAVVVVAIGSVALKAAPVLYRSKFKPKRIALIAKAPEKQNTTGR